MTCDRSGTYDVTSGSCTTAKVKHARPSRARVSRTAAEPSLLPGRLAPALLERWDYRAEASRALTGRDRSAIYGGFHLYVLKD